MAATDVLKRLMDTFGHAIEHDEDINGGDAVLEIVEIYHLAKQALLQRVELPIDAICARLLDSEEYATESAIPEVAEDAVEIFGKLKAELERLEAANQNLVSERAEAVGLVSILYAALSDASTVVDHGDGEDYAYQTELEAARIYLGIADKPALTEVQEGDFGRTAAQLEVKYGNEHPSYTREDWRNEAGGGDTQLGYWDWVFHQVESHYDDECDECGEGKCDKLYVAGVGYICKQCATDRGNSAEVPSDALTQLRLLAKQQGLSIEIADQTERFCIQHGNKLDAMLSVIQTEASNG